MPQWSSQRRLRGRHQKLREVSPQRKAGGTEKGSRPVYEHTEAGSSCQMYCSFAAEKRLQ